jgi:hypothetical protein
MYLFLRWISSWWILSLILRIYISQKKVNQMNQRKTHHSGSDPL